MKRQKKFVQLILLSQAITLTSSANAMIPVVVASTVITQNRIRQERQRNEAARARQLQEAERIRREQARREAERREAERREAERREAERREQARLERENMLAAMSPQERKDFLLDEFRQKVRRKINAFISREERITSYRLLNVASQYEKTLRSVKKAAFRLTETLLLEHFQTPGHQENLGIYRETLNHETIAEEVRLAAIEATEEASTIIRNETDYLGALHTDYNDEVLEDYLAEKIKDLRVKILDPDITTVLQADFASLQKEILEEIRDIVENALLIEKEKEKNNISLKKGHYFMRDYEVRKGGGLFGFLTSSKYRLKKSS